MTFPDGKNRKKETLFQRYGILFLIDSGMSQGIEDSDSTGGALRIAGPAGQQEAVVICANGKEKDVGQQESPTLRGAALRQVRRSRWAYYVLGDNSTNSFDSRYWGFVPAANMKGRVAFCFSPRQRAGAVK